MSTAEIGLGADNARAVRASPAHAAGTGAGYRAAKRLVDVVTAAVLLLVLLPVLVVLAVTVRLDSSGPALFRQLRVGRNGREFRMLKFRTMRADADDALHRAYVRRLMTEQVPPDGGEQGVYKLCADPRVTRVGGFLRRTSLDELPQLLNVLRGQMSLVGPRPALGWEVEMYSPAHRLRLLAKPGLTGLWQVSGRSALTLPQALDLDVEYVRRRGFLLDLAILLRTPSALLRRSAR